MLDCFQCLRHELSACVTRRAFTFSACVTSLRHECLRQCVLSVLSVLASRACVVGLGFRVWGLWFMVYGLGFACVVVRFETATS